MNVLHVSRTPVAGVPYIVRDLMNTYLYGTVQAKTLGPPARYGDGRRWPQQPEGDYRNARDAKRLIAWADVLVLHNGSPPPQGTSKPMLCYYQSEPWNVNRTMEQQGVPCYTLAQYHATLYDLPIIPNMVDIYKDIYRPRSRRPDPAKRVLIGYSPSTRRDRTKDNLWNSKGYKPTMKVLNNIGRIFNVEVRVLEGLPFTACMQQRGDCHIVIDEVVTGSYHRCTLEASSQGQVVINGLSQAVRDVVARVTGTQLVPWIVTSAEKLEYVLEQLIDRREELPHRGGTTRQWMQEHWEPKALLKRFWLPALESAKPMSTHKRNPQQHSRIHKRAVLHQRAQKRMQLPTQGPAQLVIGPNVHKASELRDTLKGRPCIIMGNAYSLNLMDLDKVKRFATIGCNRILRLLQPHYYICVDRGPYVQDIDLIRKFKGVRVLSSTIYDERIICHRVPLQPLPKFKFHTFRAATMARRQLLDEKRGHFVETDWDLPVPSASNISWPMFQLAVMLGANPIGIAGIDLAWRSKKESHFFGAGEKEGAFELSVPFLQRVFHKAAMWAHEQGIKVFNLSPEGMLNAFQRIDENEFHRRFEGYADGGCVCPRELLELELDRPAATRAGPVVSRHQPHTTCMRPGPGGYHNRPGRAARRDASAEARARAAAALQRNRRPSRQAPGGPG